MISSNRSTLAVTLSLLGAAGCIADLSPDPYNGLSTQEAVTKDAGTKDAGGKLVVSRRDAGSPPSNTDDDDPSEADADDGGTGETGDQPGDQTGDQMPAKSGCDLSGRWILSERTMSNGAGAKQVSVAWYYVELQQQGNDTVMANTVMCGGKTTGLSPIIVTMDDSKAWPEYMAHKEYDGRKGTSVPSASGCSVTFEKRAFIRGATPSIYQDLSKALPTVDEEADGTAPGWEDWDNDGNPGITMKIAGSIMGTLYVAARTWTQASGTIDANATTFTVPLNWGQDRSNLGYDGSPLLTAQAAKDTDASQHFAEMTRLGDNDAIGDDAAKCQAIRALAATLTPNAMK